MKKLQNDVCVQQEIKKSKFICYLHPVNNEEEALSFFTSIRREHPKATHVCTAFKTGSTGRSSDDGEPSGTAGRPMLSVLNGSEFDGIAAAVVRYFGGTLLGKGGLVKAYSSSVSLALEQGKGQQAMQMQVWQIVCDYSKMARVDAWILKKNTEVLFRDWGVEALVQILVDKDPSNELATLGLKPEQICYLKEIEALR